MAYRLEAGEPLEAGVRRIAQEQLERGLAELDDPELPLAEKVHQLRKRCKKLRGLVRLLRPALSETYQLENVWYRETARRLGELRDVDSRQAVFDGLLESLSEKDRTSLIPLRELLAEPATDRTGGEDFTRQTLEEVRQRFLAGRERIESWCLGDSDVETLTEGLARSYKRAAAAMEQAQDQPNLSTLHEWRKQVKYHWYHTRLLQPLWKSGLKARRAQLARLAETLGQEHDLGLFRDYLKELENPPVEPETRQRLQKAIRRGRSRLRKRAWKLGEKLFARKSRRLTRHLEQGWSAWR